MSQCHLALCHSLSHSTWVWPFYLNPHHTEFIFIGNLKICLHILKMAQVVEILSCGRQCTIYSAYAISLLLVTWWCKNTDTISHGFDIVILEYSAFRTRRSISLWPLLFTKHKFSSCSIELTINIQGLKYSMKSMKIWWKYEQNYELLPIVQG